MSPNFSFKIEPPSAPKNLSVVKTDVGKVTLSWKPPDNDGGSPVTGYILQVAPAGGKKKKYDTVAKPDGNTFQYEVTGLKDGKEYVFRIKAENPAGASEELAELNKSVKASLVIGELRTKLIIYQLNMFYTFSACKMGLSYRVVFSNGNGLPLKCLISK